LYSRHRPDFTEVVLFVGFAIFALTALRNTVWFDLVAAPILARHLPTIDWRPLLDGLLRFRRFSSLTRWLGTPKDRVLAPRSTLNTFIAGAAVIALVVVSPWVHPRLYGTTLLDSNTPRGAMDYIDRHSLEGNIFHPQIYGDYLIWRLWPRQRSFFDGRVHCFADSFVHYYQRVFHDSHWEELLAGYDIRFLLLSKHKEQPDSRRMIDRAQGSAGWRVLYEDETSVLFEQVR